MIITLEQPLRLATATLLAMSLLLVQPPSVADEPCLNEVPDALTDALMQRTIARLGLLTQDRLLTWVAQGDDLDDAEQEQVARYAAISGASPSPLQPLPVEPPAPASLQTLGLPLADYRWNAAQGRLDPAVCADLSPRAPADCPPGVSDTHNLVVSFLRARHGLCGAAFDWTPTDTAHPLVAEVAGILAAPAYYAALESWLENDRDWSFRRSGNFFTLLYTDYLALAFEHGQINFALSEFLGRRHDLRSAYPALETLRRQLALLKELDLTE